MWGKSLINDYVDLFTKEYSFRNAEYAQISFHVILGQLLKKIFFRQGGRFIDIRTHLLLFQPSGTGKGAGYSLIVKILKELGMNVVSFSESTSAGLIGTYDHFDETQNKWIMKEGELLSADVVAMEEAGTLFDNINQYTSMNMTYMQQTMNSIYDESSKLEKILGGGKIEKKSHASFLLMSYLPQNIYEVLINRGFLQRMTVLWRNINFDERQLMLDYAVQKMINESKIPWTELWNKKREKIYSIVKRLQILRDFYGDDMQEIPIDGDAIELAHEYIKQLFDAVGVPSPFIREKIDEFYHRYFEMLLKYAVHYAIINLKDKVEKTDVASAFLDIIRPIWEKNIVFIEYLLTTDYKKAFYYRQFLDSAIIVYTNLSQKSGSMYIPYDKFIKTLQDQWNCSKPTVKSRLSTFMSSTNKHFEVKEIDNVPYIKLLRNEMLVTT